jgi:hypothetical protein
MFGYLHTIFNLVYIICSTFSLLLCRIWVLFVLIITSLLYVMALLAFIFRLLLLFRELLVIFSCWSCNLWNLFGRKGRKDNYFSMLWCLVGRMQNMCFFFVW